MESLSRNVCLFRPRHDKRMAEAKKTSHCAASFAHWSVGSSDSRRCSVVYQTAGTAVGILFACGHQRPTVGCPTGISGNILHPNSTQERSPTDFSPETKQKKYHDSRTIRRGNRSTRPHRSMDFGNDRSRRRQSLSAGRCAYRSLRGDTRRDGRQHHLPHEQSGNCTITQNSII